MKDTPQNREYFHRVQEMVEPCIKQSNDGYYYYMADVKGLGGLLSSSDLRCIAFILDRLNEPYDKHLDEYFKNNT